MIVHEVRWKNGEENIVCRVERSRDGGVLRVVVNGGFSEVSTKVLTVHADMDVPQDEFDPTVIVGVNKDTEGDIAKGTDGWRRDKLSHKVDQLKALQAELQ